MGAYDHGVLIFMGCIFCAGAYYPNFTVVYHGTAICTTEQEELGGGRTRWAVVLPILVLAWRGSGLDCFYLSSSQMYYSTVNSCYLWNSLCWLVSLLWLLRWKPSGIIYLYILSMKVIMSMIYRVLYLGKTKLSCKHINCGMPLSSLMFLLGLLFRNHWNAGHQI